MKTESLLRDELLNELLSPDLSTYTTPTVYDNRIKNISGGYKRVGNIVFVNMFFTFGVEMGSSNWSVCVQNFPHDNNMHSLLCASSAGIFASVNNIGSLVFYPVRTQAINELGSVSGYYLLSA